jgi:hypothetical protein
MSLQLCHPYVWEDPRYIFRAWTTDAKCVSELVNRVVITYIVFILIGVTVSSFTQIKSAPLVAGVLATVALIPTLIGLSKTEKFAGTQITRDASGGGISGNEGFKGGIAPGNPATLPLPIQSETHRGVKNPFHNILVDEYKYAPTRAAAPDITTSQSKIALDAMFRTQWYSDPTDVFGKTQSQRTFVTAPVTTIPNDQGSYQNWLYKIPGKTCKEGNPDACYGGTDGAVMPWLNI